MEYQLKRQKEQFDRERKLLQASNNTNQLNAESKFSSKLAEARANLDAEKNDIFSFVCNEFRDNFDPRDPINERSFRKCVINTKQELSRLQKSDSQVRKMVRASPTQSTTDAVAQLIVSH